MIDVSKTANLDKCSLLRCNGGKGGMPYPTPPLVGSSLGKQERDMKKPGITIH
jgi:hypothetical protein